MEANELIIGNYIDYNGNSSEYQILISDFVNIYNDREELKYYRPYKLTEEWLLRFGFTYNLIESLKEKYKDYNNTIMQLGTTDFVLTYSYPDWHVHTYCVNVNKQDGIGFILASVQYVHQLQNLYFALTNTELEIKL